MKRGMIRALWGIHSNENRMVRRRYQVDRNIEALTNNPHSEPFEVFVMGRENYEGLKSMGFKCVLVDEKPFAFDLVKEQYRHKLELIRYAMEDYGYDEVVYLDWDCVPQKKIPNDFWSEMAKRDVFQANLQLYHRRKAAWRETDVRKVPNGGFLYLRDKTLPSIAIKNWEELGRGDNDEPAWAKTVDDMMGGWKGAENYWNRFEAMYCNLHKNSPYNEIKLKQKNECFLHFQGG